MKHKTLWSVVSMALACTMAVSGFTACGGNAGKETKYTVSYVCGDMGGGTAPTGGEYKEGETFTLAQNTFTSETHAFTGWNDGAKDYAAGASYTMPAKNVTFTAQWELSDHTAPVITYAAGKQDRYTTTAGTPVTLPSATANDAIDGEVDLEVTVTSKGATVTKAANGYTFASETAGEYDVSYFAVDSAENEVEEFISVTVEPVKAETVLEQGQNNLANLAQSDVTFVENFEKGYDSPLAKGFDFSQSAGKPNASVVSSDDSIAGNSLIIDYSTCAWNTNTQFWFGSLDNYLRSGKWTISMDVTVLGGTAPSGLYFSFIYDGDNDGQNQPMSLGKVGETKTIEFSAIKSFDDTKTWHFRTFFYTGDSSYKYDDFRIAIDNIRITVKEVVNAVVERTGTPKELTATDLDGNGYTFTGADDNYTALSNMQYLDKTKLVTGDYLTTEQAANLTAANGFNSDYVILATEQLSWFESLNDLCTDGGYEYTVSMKVYAPNGSAWHMNHSDGSSHGFVQQADFKGVTTFTMTFVGGAGNRKIGLYRDGGQNIFIGDVTISRSVRADTSKTPNGYEVGKIWARGASEINGFGKGTAVTCSEVNVLAGQNGFDDKAVHYTSEGEKVFELFQAGGASGWLEQGCTYKITLNLYMVTPGALHLKLDSAFVNLEISAAGYVSKEITWVADHNVDFFCFYNQSGACDFYCSSITFKLTALA